MGEIRICGLGVNPPEDATVEALLALEGCRVVFTDVADARTRAWLKPFCRGLRPSPGAAGIVAAARPAGAAGLAVWGHPHASSILAREVQVLAYRKKLPVRVFAGVSPMGGALCRSVLFLGGMEGMPGMRSCELRELLARPGLLADGMPLVVFAEDASKEEWAKACRLLRGRYPADHPVDLYPLTSQASARVALCELAARAPGGAVIHVPAKG